MEDGTELIATRVAERTGCSLYHVTYPGTWDEARALHVSGTRIEPDATKALGAFTAHCRAVVAVHGFTRHHLREAALVGGRNINLSRLVAGELRDRLPQPAVVLDGDDVPISLRGWSLRNVTNRFPEAGTQLELSPRLRVAYPSRIFWGGSTPNENVFADAVVEAISAALDAYASLAGRVELAPRRTPDRQAEPSRLGEQKNPCDVP
jgi:phage replication-related protein YjqB (UPF0714/DUF867 family)